MDPDAYRPHERPTLEQQRDALQKGLGRAHQWAAAGRLDFDLLAEACLNNWRHDWQDEEPRGWYLGQLLDASGAAERLREPIRAALDGEHDHRVASQLRGLALHFARAGDAGFRASLYDIVSGLSGDGWDTEGENELVALDGEAGFLFAARLRGLDLTEREWCWGDGALVRHAAELLGEDRVRAALEAGDGEDIARFREGSRLAAEREASREAEPQDEPEPRPRRTLAEAEGAIAGEGRWSWLRYWWRDAEPAELRAVADALWAESDPRRLERRLFVFDEVPLPTFDPRLFGLGRHADAGVALAACRALARHREESVRPFALAEVARGNPWAVAVLARQFEPGDEARILAGVRPPEDRDDRHEWLKEVRHLLREHPASDPSRLGVLAYFENPCGFCRNDSAELLFERGVAPDWLRDECRHDAEPDTRKPAGEPA